jgi:hypothetical protein
MIGGYIDAYHIWGDISMQKSDWGNFWCWRSDGVTLQQELHIRSFGIRRIINAVLFGK